MTTAPLTEARDRLSEIVDEVTAGADACLIAKHGRPVAVILSRDEDESLMETLNVPSDLDTMAAPGEAVEDVAAGRVTPL